MNTIFDRGSRAAFAALLSFGCLLIDPTVAFAQSAARKDTNEETAHALDVEGSALLKDRRYEEACPKLAESYRLRPGTGVLMRLALCHELAGKIASAWNAYRAAAERARAAGDDLLAQLGSKRAAAVEGRIPRLVIRLDRPGEPTQELKLLRDGEELDPHSIGFPLPIDPGQHVIEAAMPGRKTFRRLLIVDDGGNYTVTLVLLPESSDAASNTSSRPADRPGGKTASGTWSSQKTAAVALGVAGITGIAAGIVLGLDTASTMNSARGLCSEGSTRCPPEALKLQDDARSTALWSTVGVSAGIAALVGGAALWLTAPKPRAEDRAAGWRVTPLVGAGLGGVRTEVSW